MSEASNVSLYGKSHKPQPYIATLAETKNQNVIEKLTIFKRTLNRLDKGLKVHMDTKNGQKFKLKTNSSKSSLNI